jgi:predicted AlkP superfamily pyrophosphatase or phosphodiesterase
MVIMDGLRYDAAACSMGFMNHLIQKNMASLYRVVAETPTLSRPLYEVLLTGTPAHISGIVSNNSVRLSRQRSIFHMARENGLTTAAAAYAWISELYNRAPFNPLLDREQESERLPIQYGRFYFEDNYPDSHLFTDAAALIQKYNPDFCLIHSMGIDFAGHRFGGESKEYRAQVILADSMLANLLPAWQNSGYHILITSDHGMGTDGLHGGSSLAERLVPLFALTDYLAPGIYMDEVPQLAVAPLATRLLGIRASQEMMKYSWPGWMDERIYVL